MAVTIDRTRLAIGSAEVDVPSGRDALASGFGWPIMKAKEPAAAPETPPYML